MALMAVAMQSKAVRGGVGGVHDILGAPLGGSWALWFYLGEIVLPVRLTMIYPRWEIDPRAAVSYLPALGSWSVCSFSFGDDGKAGGARFCLRFGSFSGGTRSGHGVG